MVHWNLKITDDSTDINHHTKTFPIKQWMNTNIETNEFYQHSAKQI